MTEPEKQPAAPPTNSRWKRWLAFSSAGVGLFIILSIVGVALAWANRTDVAEWAIATYLKDKKTKSVSVTVESLEPDHIRIKDFRMEADQTVSISSIHATYAVDDWIDGIIDSITIAGLSVETKDGPVEIDRIEGSGSFSASLKGLKSLQAGFDLVRIQTSDQTFEPSRVDIGYENGILSLDSAIAAPHGFVTLIGNGPLDPDGDPFELHIAGSVDAGFTSNLVARKRIRTAGYLSFAINAEVQDPLFFMEKHPSGRLTIPPDLTVNGQARLGLDRLSIDGTVIPMAEPDVLNFNFADLVTTTDGSNGSFKISLDAAKRKTPEIGFTKANVTLNGAYVLAKDKLSLTIGAGPVAQVRDVRLSKGLPVAGDLNLEFIDDTNTFVFDLGKGAARHSINAKLAWRDGTISMQSEGHPSDRADPVIFTLRGAFDATPLLTSIQATKGIKGNANIFLAGRITQPLLIVDAMADGAAPWPGDVRLDGAAKLNTTGLAIPGADAAKSAKDSIEITLKGFNGSSGHQRGKVTIAAKLDKRSFGGTMFDEALLSLDGRLTSGARGYQFIPSFDSTLFLKNVRTASGLVVPTGLTLQLTGDKNHLTVPNDLSGAFHALTFAHLDADGYIRSKGEKQPIRLTIPQLISRQEENAQYQLYATGAVVDLPKSKLSAHGINASVETSATGIKFGLEAGDIRHAAQPPLTTPLSFSAKGQVRKQTLRMTLQARQRYSPLQARATVRHNLKTNTGRVDFRVPRFELKSKKYTIADLFPPAAQMFDDAKGASSLKGHLLWDKDVVSGQMALQLENLSLHTPDMKLDDLEGTVNFIELVPLSMPPRQRIKGSVTVGDLGPLPVQLEFQLREDGAVAIQDFDVGFAGGRMRTRGLVKPGDELDADGMIYVQSVDLAQLFQLIGLEGLEGTGRITGKVPVRLRGENLTIGKGTLNAEGPGKLKYSGTALQQQLSNREDTVGTVAQVLSDFRYKKLSMELTKEPSGTGAIMLRMDGANPAVYDGHPFAFNIRIESDFHKLGRIALGGVEAVTDIIRRPERPAGQE